MKTRTRQRQNRRTKRREENRQIKQELIDIRNACGVLDPTPFMAVNSLAKNCLTSFCEKSSGKRPFSGKVQ